MKIAILILLTGLSLDVLVDSKGALWYSTDEGHLYKLTAAKPAVAKSK